MIPTIAPPVWATPYVGGKQQVTFLDLYLAAWAYMVDTGFAYDNAGPWRCTGERHSVDCSGGCVLAYNMAADAFGLPRISCTNSFNLSAECHQYPRPDWLTEQCGSGVGLMVTIEQSREFALTLLFHGNNEGQSPDGSGDGHVENGLGGGRTVGAHSHATGLGYRTDEDPSPGFLNAAALPPWEPILACLAPAPPAPPQEIDMQVFLPPNRPNHLDAHTQFVPAGNPLFPLGALISRDAAKIAGDKKTNDPNVRILTPKGPHGWVACTVQRDGRGVRVLDDQGNLSPRDALLWI